MATLAQRFVSLAAAVTLLGLSVSCNKQPTVPTATLVNDDKTGTVNPGGQDVQTFTVNYSYDYTPATLTVKSLTSVATGAALSITIGVALGSIAFDGTCTRSSVATAPAAAVGQVNGPTGNIFINSTYCLAVYDNGTVTEPVKYTVTVQHY
jgi:hypothetical protein